MGIVTDRDKMLALLRQVGANEVSPENALARLCAEPFSDLGYAKVDHHRALRQGVGEVIYGSGKTPEQIAGILQNIKGHGGKDVLVTRIPQGTADFLSGVGIPMDYHPLPQLGIAFADHGRAQVGNIIVASAGTSDIAVCEEAALTAETLCNKVTRIYDVGVAGLHRLLSKYEALIEARVIIVVAGMDGALASVVGGLVGCPVIAVPTSVGYGANFAGLSALLTMLNSCAAGVSVVNIDNGFGAGYLAGRINQMKGI